MKLTLSKFERIRADLRSRIDRKELVVCPGVQGPFFAKIVEKAGFDALYMSGAGTAANVLGMPDVSLINAVEMATNLKHICRAVNIPVIADMDTGYGNAINVMRTVRDYEQAGVAGFHMEDQIMPKRCGFTLGKVLIPKEEAIGKIKAAVEARDDPNLLIIARCDARGAIAFGGPEEQRKELYDRCNAYAKAGADVIFAERPEKPEDLKNDLKNIKAPLLLNGIHPRYGISKVDEVRKLGYAIVIFAGNTMGPALEASYQYMLEWKKNGEAPTKLTIDFTKPTIDSWELVGLPETRAYEEKFLPKEELVARYGGTKAPRETSRSATS